MQVYRFKRKKSLAMFFLQIVLSIPKENNSNDNQRNLLKHAVSYILLAKRFNCHSVSRIICAALSVAPKTLCCLVARITMLLEA